MNVELATLLQQAAQQQSAVNSIQPAAQPAQSAMSRETIMTMLDQLGSGCHYIASNTTEPTPARAEVAVLLQQLLQRAPTAQRALTAEEQNRALQQANTPTSGSFVLNLQTVIMQATILSLCDGAGCAAMALKKVDCAIAKYYAVEPDETSKLVCQHANPATDKFPGVNHGWRSDVFTSLNRTSFILVLSTSCFMVLLVKISLC